MPPAGVGACPDRVVAAQHMVPASARLSGVAAVSAHDVWAVGQISTTTTAITVTEGLTESATVPLIEHFDGTVWCAVDTDNSNSGALHAVTAVSADDVWATGQQIEHWDGHAWAVVPSVQAPFGNDGLTSISASSLPTPGRRATAWWNGGTASAGRRCHCPDRLTRQASNNRRPSSRSPPATPS